MKGASPRSRGLAVRDWSRTITVSSLALRVYSFTTRCQRGPVVSWLGAAYFAVMLSDPGKTTVVSKEYEQGSQFHRCRTRRSSTCSDHSGINSNLPHWAHSITGREFAYFVPSLRYTEFLPQTFGLLRACINALFKYHPATNCPFRKDIDG